MGFADGDGYAALRLGLRIEAASGLVGIDLARQAGVSDDDAIGKRREFEAVLFFDVGLALKMFSGSAPGTGPF